MSKNSVTRLTIQDSSLDPNALQNTIVKRVTLHFAAVCNIYRQLAADDKKMWVHGTFATRMYWFHVCDALSL